MSLLMNMSHPRRDPPSGLSVLFSRLLRREKPNTCLIVFEHPDKNKPVCYRTYVNDEHYKNFTDVVDLVCFLSRVEDRMPYIKFYVRSTMKYIIPYKEQREIAGFLEEEIWSIENFRSIKDGTFLRGCGWWKWNQSQPVIIQQSRMLCSVSLSTKIL